MLRRRYLRLAWLSNNGSEKVWSISIEEKEGHLGHNPCAAILVTYLLSNWGCFWKKFVKFGKGVRDYLLCPALSCNFPFQWKCKNVIFCLLGRGGFWEPTFLLFETNVVVVYWRCAIRIQEESLWLGRLDNFFYFNSYAFCKFLVPDSRNSFVKLNQWWQELKDWITQPLLHLAHTSV